VVLVALYDRRVVGWFRMVDNNIINTRLLTYDIKVRIGLRHKIRAVLDYHDVTTLNVICANLISCLRKGCVLVYSRNTSRVGNSNKGVNARKVIKCVDFLERGGYIVSFKGKVKKKRGASGMHGCTHLRKNMLRMVS
jgi:hypothetical protein